MTFSPWIGRGARLAVLLLFLFSALQKFADFSAFALAIDRYRLLPSAWILPMAFFLPWLEFWCAFALAFTPPWRRAAWILILLMLFVFTAAKISALARGLDIACGCTSSDTPMNWTDVALNLFWLAVSGVGLWRDRRGGG